MRLSMSFHRFGNVFTVETPLPAGRQEERKGFALAASHRQSKNPSSLWPLCLCGEKSILDKSEAPRPCLRRSGFAQAGTGRGFREM